jgi:hypothetical protein
MGENFIGIYGLTDRALEGLGLPGDPGALLEGYVRSDGWGLSVISVRNGLFVVGSYLEKHGGLVKVREASMVEDLEKARAIVAEDLFRPLKEGARTLH